MLAYWGVFYCSGDTKAEEGTWQGKTYLKADGNQQQARLFDQTHQKWFYLKEDGQRAENGWLTVAGKITILMLMESWLQILGSTNIMSMLMVSRLRTSGFFDQEGQSWLYLKSDGQKAKNEWISQGQEKYYLKEDGKMAKDEWITQGEDQYYVNSQGKILKNTWHGSHYLSDKGNKVKQSWIYDANYSSWFYLKADGNYAENGWQTVEGKDYYFKRGGYLATNTWLGKSYVTSSGHKAKNKLDFR